MNELMNPRENGLNKMVEGKEDKFRGFLETSWRLSRSFISSVATAKEVAMCNDITCA